MFILKSTLFLIENRYTCYFLMDCKGKWRNLPRYCSRSTFQFKSEYLRETNYSSYIKSLIKLSCEFCPHGFDIVICIDTSMNQLLIEDKPRSRRYDKANLVYNTLRHAGL